MSSPTWLMTPGAGTGDRPLIVVGWDEGAVARGALSVGLTLADAVAGMVMLVVVVPDPVDRGDAVREAAAALATVDPTVVADAVVLCDRSPTRALRELVAAQDARFAVVERDRHAISGVSCPLVVVPPALANEAEQRLMRIGVAFDGWTQSRVALEVAIRLARRAGAELVLLTVADAHTASSAEPAHDAGEALDDHRHVAQRYLVRELAQLPTDVRARARVVLCQPAAALATAAQAEELHLLVAGSRGHGPIGRVLTGSVSHSLQRRCPCPVMVVPARRAP